MQNINYSLLIISIVLFLGCGGSTGTNQNFNFSEDNGGITLPDGFQAVVVADSIGPARHITTDDNGDIYVALSEEQNGNGITALRDEDDDGQADIVEYFGNLTGTGIRYHDGYLYRSSDTSIVRYELNSDELVPESEAETVVGGFPEQNSHAAKSFTFDDSGNLYVNVGGPSNACQEEARTPGSPGMDPCPQLENHAGIWQFDADTTGQTMQDDGTRYATGIRNSVALNWSENADQLYVVQHGRDQLYSLWSDYFTEKDNAELPAEEFFQVNEGDDFGWPYTYYDGNRDQKMQAPEYGGDGETPAEGDYEDPIMAFPAHWAPNDLLFYNGDQFPERYQNGAFVAFHGSWNRAPEPQDGYNVVFVPFEDDKPAGDYEVFADGFAGADTLRSPGEAEYRPMGLTVANDGSLLIVDSLNGKIWRIVNTN